MRWKHVFAVSILMVLMLVVSCSNDAGKKTTGEARRIGAADSGFYGWDSSTLHVPYAQLEVVPDLGGKIMGYELRGYQVLWHDTTKEGQLYQSEGYGFGESFFNPGGAKVWPAPQGWGGSGEWPGPPDNVLDGSPYDFSMEDGIITVTSPEDNGEGRSGLQYTHRYSLRNSSSVVDLNLSMTNVVDRPVKWSLWHIATVPVDRPATVYLPIDGDNWHVMYGDKGNPQWLGVEDGLFRVRYDKRVGKIGLKLREGWAAWHDEENDVVFSMQFPIKRGAEYPDGGSNFEIWTSGAGIYQANNQEFQSEYSPDSAMMELEVMGPLTQLAPGMSSSLDVTWQSCRCSGVKRVTPYGVVAEEPNVVDGIVYAKFGVFYGGYLMAEFLGKDGKRKGIKNMMEVSPLNEVIVTQSTEKFLTYADGVRYYIQPLGQKEMHVLGEIMAR
ncbi:DUF4380 domain-containing protein [Candidatus Latescibacterota bacterium]